MTTRDIKARLTKAFRELRREGFIARQNFACCGSCASYEIAKSVSDKIDAGLPEEQHPMGCVFYSRQDNEAFAERDRRWRGTDDFYLYLKYGAVHTHKHGAIGHQDVRVGEQVRYECERAGLWVEWSGSDDDCVCIRGCWEDKPRFDFGNLGVAVVVGTV